MRLVSLVPFALLFLAAPAAADDTADTIGEAASAYAAGDLEETSALLSLALAAVNSELVGQLADYLPAAPDGWTGGETEGVDVVAPEGSPLAGLVVSRDYRTPRGSTVVVSIAPDSPLYGSLKAFVTSPSLASISGRSDMTRVTVCGFDAVEDLGGAGGRCEISILAGTRTLISVTGRSRDDVPDLRSLASAIDCRGITAVIE